MGGRMVLRNLRPAPLGPNATNEQRAMHKKALRAAGQSQIEADAEDRRQAQDLYTTQFKKWRDALAVAAKEAARLGQVLVETPEVYPPDYLAYRFVNEEPDGYVERGRASLHRALAVTGKLSAFADHVIVDLMQTAGVSGRRGRPPNDDAVQMRDLVELFNYSVSEAEATINKVTGTPRVKGSLARHARRKRKRK